MTNFSDISTSALINLRDLGQKKLNEQIEICEDAVYVGREYLNEVKEMNTEIIRRLKKEETLVTKIWKLFK